MKKNEKKGLLVGVIIFMMISNIVVADTWQQISPGLHCSFVTKDTRYAKEQVPSVTEKHTWSTTGWKGERVSEQFLLWSSAEVDNVSIQVGNLSSGNHMIPASAIKYHFIDYVISDDGGAGCGNNMNRPTSLVADILDIRQSTTVEANKVQPVWLSVDIPRTIQKGIYTGNIVVKGPGISINLEINIEVLDMTLSKPVEWTYHLDLWQNPWSVARYHNVVPWSEEHWNLLDPLLTTLAEAGQKKVVTTTILDRAWNGQTYDPIRV